MTYVIAEVGSNWRDLSDCMQSVSTAKAVGADAVKFQAFTHAELYGWQMDQNELRHALPLDWLPKLKEKADACGIDFLCTAFSPQGVEAVDPFVKRHKVASSDLTYPQLLDAVKKTGKPVLLSTGASSHGDITRALAILYPANVTLMYCVSAYPARMTDLRVLGLLKQAYGLPVGFSDHSLDVINAPVLAQERGAVVLEKHFTAVPEVETPDRPHSLNAHDFRLMVEHLKGIRKPIIGPQPEEQAMFLRHNRRLVATADVAAGASLRFDQNYGAFRASADDMRGLIPFAWESVEGRAATKPITRGSPIGPGDFQ